jgi:hypothetical protein
MRFRENLRILLLALEGGKEGGASGGGALGFTSLEKKLR